MPEDAPTGSCGRVVGRNLGWIVSWPALAQDHRPRSGRDLSARHLVAPAALGDTLSGSTGGDSEESGAATVDPGAVNRDLMNPLRFFHTLLSAAGSNHHVGRISRL